MAFGHRFLSLSDVLRVCACCFAFENRCCPTFGCRIHDDTHVRLRIPYCLLLESSLSPPCVHVPFVVRLCCRAGIPYVLRCLEYRYIDFLGRICVAGADMDMGSDETRRGVSLGDWSSLRCRVEEGFSRSSKVLEDGTIQVCFNRNEILISLSRYPIYIPLCRCRGASSLSPAFVTCTCCYNSNKHRVRDREQTHSRPTLLLCVRILGWFSIQSILVLGCWWSSFIS